MLNVHQKAPVVLRHLQQIRRRLAEEHPRRLRQSFLAPHLHVATLVDATRMQQVGEQPHQQGLLLFHAQGQRLQHQKIAVAIHDEAGQPVRFSVDQAISGGPRLICERLPGGDGPAQAARPEVAVNGLALVPGE